jgi:putative ABC transport system permease protein
MLILWIQDLRYAVRQLRRSLSFTLAVILTLAVGIGLNAAIFTIVDCVLLQPLGYHDADRIYSINTRFLRDGRSAAKIGGDDYVDVARSTHSLESLAYYNFWEDGLQLNGHSYYVNIASASPRFGTVLGVEPVAGRLFHDDVDGSEVLVANSFAREHYGSAQAAVGQSLDYDRRTRTIVGVLPDGFSFPGKTVVWVERPTQPDIASRSAYNQRAVGKIRVGVAPTQLNAELATLSRQLQAAYPEDKEKAFEAVPLQDQIVGGIRPMLRLLMGSAALVLLIVCANIGHLQLVRSTRMQRDVSIRAALGATSGTVVRRVLLESLVLAGVGCAAALLIAEPALRVLTLMAPAEIPRLGDVRLNTDVLLFSFVASMATMVVTALVPAWRSWRVSPGAVLKLEQATSSGSGHSQRLRDGLIVGQVALTLTLSVISVLLVRQMIAEAKQYLGFNADNLVLLDIHAPTPPAGLEQTSVVRLRSMLDSMAQVPGVSEAAAVGGVPMGSGPVDVGYAIRGRSEFKPGEKPLPYADVEPVTPAYFRTMGIPLIKGRLFADTDTPDRTPVLLISEELARQQFPGEDPIGHQIMCGYDFGPNEAVWWTIVGVVGSVRQDSPASEPAQTLYVPIAQHAGRATDMQIAVRTGREPAAMIQTLERMLEHNYPMIAVSATTMRDAVGESSRAERFRTVLLSCFAGISILLAALGMYGVTAYTVAQRRFEIALRFALGAQRGQIVAMTLQHGLGVACLGIGAGLALSFALARVFGNLLGKLPGFDAASYAIAVLGVIAISAAAVLVPSRRAAQVEPMQVLRGE